jgi:site-specific DNA recombinase
VQASIYSRISRDRVGAGLGVATQQADCRELAQSLGCTIVSVHTDNDLSAYRTRKPRPGYVALLGEVKAGDIDAVIAWHTDRLHRSPAELEPT